MNKNTKIKDSGFKDLYVVVNVLKVYSTIVGVDSEEDPPVTIPNTEVKLLSGENTEREAVWKNSKMPTFHLRTCIGSLFLPS